MSTSTSNNRTRETCLRPDPYRPPGTFDVLSGGDSRDARSQEVFKAYREDRPDLEGINPIIEGRLFTCLDASLNPAWPIIPVIGLKFAELHEDDQEVFCKCNSHQSYQEALIKFLKHSREHPKTPPRSELLEALCREVPSEGKVKKWKCAFKGCEKAPDTLVHMKDHLLGLKHFKNHFFPCSECVKSFCLKHDLAKHIKNIHPSIVDISNNHGAKADHSRVRGQIGTDSVANSSVGTSSGHARYSTHSIPTGSQSTMQSQRTTTNSAMYHNDVTQDQSLTMPQGTISSSLFGQMSLQPAYNPQPSAYGSTTGSPLLPPGLPYQAWNGSNVAPPISQIEATHDMRHMGTTQSYRPPETPMTQQLLLATSIPNRGPMFWGTAQPINPEPPHATFDQQRQFVPPVQRQFVPTHQMQVFHGQTSTSYHQQESLPSVSDPGAGVTLSSPARSTQRSPAYTGHSRY